MRRGLLHDALCVVHRSCPAFRYTSCHGHCAYYEVHSGWLRSPTGARLTRPSRTSGTRQSQQNSDVAVVLENLQAQQCFSRRVFLYLEGDFSWCPGASDEISNLVAWLERDDVWGNWAFIRVSYGMNGWLMKCQDLPRLRTYLDEHILESGLDWWLPRVYNDSERFV